MYYSQLPIEFAVNLFHHMLEIPSDKMLLPRSCKSTKLLRNFKIERIAGIHTSRIAGIHTSETMAKLELADKYKGLEKNVW